MSQHEPPYPDHDTVIFSIRDPVGVGHRKHPECEKEEWHLISECGLYETLPEKETDETRDSGP
jgi:hypothetical protein